MRYIFYANGSFRPLCKYDFTPFISPFKSLRVKGRKNGIRLYFQERTDDEKERIAFSPYASKRLRNENACKI